MEDKDLMSRTLPPRHLHGYNIPRPKTGLEEIPKALYRTPKPMERIRVPRELRDEMSLPFRDVDPDFVPEDGSTELQKAWKWDKAWEETIPVQVAKMFLERDMEKEIGQPIDDWNLFLYVSSWIAIDTWAVRS